MRFLHMKKFLILLALSFVSLQVLGKEINLQCQGTYESKVDGRTFEKRNGIVNVAVHDVNGFVYIQASGLYTIGVTNQKGDGIYYVDDRTTDNKWSITSKTSDSVWRDSETNFEINRSTGYLKIWQSTDSRKYGCCTSVEIIAQCEKVDTTKKKF